MPKTRFADCALKGVNFEQADLSAAAFSNCNLEQALFDETNLTAADFTTAYNFVIDPERNVIKKAKFAVQGIPGLLQKYDLKIE